LECTSSKGAAIRLLNGFSQEVDISPGAFLTDGARDRLVLASGGVARDFLAIFRASVDVARERCAQPVDDKVGVEDVNIAAGTHDSSKQEEFKRDAATEDKDSLSPLCYFSSYSQANNTGPYNSYINFSRHFPLQSNQMGN
jgi:hypothetical protein